MKYGFEFMYDKHIGLALYRENEKEALIMASTIQVSVEDDLKEPNPYVPMTEEAMLAKLKKSREQGKYRAADDVISDMRSKYGL